MRGVDRYACHTSHLKHVQSLHSLLPLQSHIHLTRDACLKTSVVCSMKTLHHLARHVSCLDTRYMQHLHSVLIFLTFLTYPGTSTGGHIFDPLRRSTSSSRAWHFSRTTSSHRLWAPQDRRQPDRWWPGKHELHWNWGSCQKLLLQPLQLKTQRKASRRHRMRTSTTNNFVLCQLHHCIFRSEKQVLNDHKFITLNEKASCQVHLKIRSLSVQGNLSQCFQVRVAWIKTHFPRQSNLLMLFLGVMNRFSDSLTQRMFAKSLFLMEIEVTCLFKRDLNTWSRNTKWNLLTIVFMSYSSKIMLSDWNCITSITDLWNLEESKYDYKKNYLWRKKVLRHTQIRHIHEMGEMKGAQASRVDKFSLQ